MPGRPTPQHPAARVVLMTPRVVTPLVAVLVAVLIATSGQGTVSGSTARMVPVAEPFDPEVVLPARVDAALHRTFAAVQRAVGAIDDRRSAGARRSLRAANLGFNRSQSAVLHQVQAVPDPEGESTAGPDSALAALNVAQASIGELSGLFDRVRARRVNVAIAVVLGTAEERRAALLAVLAGLDPEVAGAPYADALADTVPAYTDEVAAIQEALGDDRLTGAARRALTAALARSQAAEALMTITYGGGE
jgi:hypothetical protein